MTHIQLPEIKGKVLKFDRRLTVSKVLTEQGKEIEVHASAFSSGSPTRFPKNGENVTLIFDSSLKEIIIMRPFEVDS